MARPLFKIALYACPYGDSLAFPATEPTDYAILGLHCPYHIAATLLPFAPGPRKRA
jgi:hypothetical protein